MQGKFALNGCLLLTLSICLGVAGCGDGQAASQNMPIGGTPFTGIFTPGIGNLTQGQTANTCTNNGPENLTFVVAESTTYFYDLSIGSGQIPIINGVFSNPVNQNNTCFTGTVTYSQCGNAQSGKITYNACTVNLIGSQYQFSASYYLYAANKVLLQTGSIYATK